jgi:hypothetical protein
MLTRSFFEEVALSHALRFWLESKLKLGAGGLCQEMRIVAGFSDDKVP